MLPSGCTVLSAVAAADPEPPEYAFGEGLGAALGLEVSLGFGVALGLGDALGLGAALGSGSSSPGSGSLNGTNFKKSPQTTLPSASLA
ncbi:hypothetical protein D3C75_724180 [compost metagenome]